MKKALLALSLVGILGVAPTLMVSASSEEVETQENTTVVDEVVNPNCSIGIEDCEGKGNGECDGTGMGRGNCDGTAQGNNGEKGARRGNTDGTGQGNKGQNGLRRGNCNR